MLDASAKRLDTFCKKMFCMLRHPWVVSKSEVRGQYGEGLALSG